MHTFVANAAGIKYAIALNFKECLSWLETLYGKCKFG